MNTENYNSDGEWIDEFGGKYSADKTKLIKYDYNCVNPSYNIKEGTKIICNNGFYFPDTFCSLNTLCTSSAKDTNLASTPISLAVVNASRLFYGSMLSRGISWSFITTRLGPI